MHQVARRLGLRSKSFGKGEDRHLTISRWRLEVKVSSNSCFYLRKFNGLSLLEELLNRGGETEKYTLIAPRAEG